MPSNRKPKQLDIQVKPKRQEMPKLKRQDSRNPDDYPCPVCGGSDFEWGYLIGSGYSTKKMPMFKTDPLRMRVCQSCGNALTFLTD